MSIMAKNKPQGKYTFPGWTPEQQAAAAAAARAETAAAAEAARKSSARYRQSQAHPQDGNGKAPKRCPPPPREESLPEPLCPVLFSQLKAVPIEAIWIWEDYIARHHVTMKSALFKAGKTTLDAHLLQALGADGIFCGKPVKKSRVLVVTEEHESRWAERRDKLGIGDHCEALVRPFAAKPTYLEWLVFLKRLGALQAEQKYDVILFDTISNLWPVIRENDACEVQAALMPLHAMMGDAALVLDHHFRKSDGSEGTASRGSGALPSWVDIILELRRYDANNRKDHRRVLNAYGRINEPDDLVIELSEDGKTYTAHGDRKQVASKELRALIREVLPGAPPGLSWEEIMEEIEGTKPGRQRLLDELRQGAEEDLPAWHREGEGRKGSAYTFWRDGGRVKTPFG
jgi:hypothetical protein